MKVAIVRSESRQSQEVEERLMKGLNKASIERDDDHPDIVITIGGDGTMLRAFHNYIDQIGRIRFTGIHTGHLGFYTDWQVSELPELLSALEHDSVESISYPLLKLTIFYRDQSEKEILALNEGTIRRYEGTLTGEVFIRGQRFELFKGDGLCISTPTGSTGLNKSLGGAVIHPRLDALEMTEIASINNRVYRTISSPVIIAPDEWIDIYLDNEHLDGTFITVDQLTASLEEAKQVKFEIADERIRFARYRHTHFWDRVQQSFL